MEYLKHHGRCWSIILFLQCAAVLLCTPLSFAKNRPTNIQAGVSFPTLTIENTDGTKAGYTGQSIFGRVNFKVLGERTFKTNLTLGYRQTYLENKNNGQYSEFAKHRGMSAGLIFSSFNMFLSAEYMDMTAEHSMAGRFASNTEFDYTSFNYALGFQKEFGKIGLGFAYQMGTGEAKKSDTGLSAASDIEEKAFVIYINYGIRTSLKSIGSGLVGGGGGDN